jgi:hypothetical protein
MNIVRDLKRGSLSVGANEPFTEIVPLPGWNEKRTKTVVTSAVKEIKGVTDARLFSRVVKNQITSLVEAIESWPSYNRVRLEMWVRFTTTPENFAIIIGKPQFTTCDELVDDSNYKRFCQCLTDLIEKSPEAMGV